MATDRWVGGTNPAPQLGAPLIQAETVTPSDSVDVTNTTRGLYVGVTGDVSVIMQGGATVLFKAVPAGTLLPIRVSRVRATGTTATTMLALD